MALITGEDTDLKSNLFLRKHSHLENETLHTTTVCLNMSPTVGSAMGSNGGRGFQLNLAHLPKVMPRGLHFLRFHLDFFFLGLLHAECGVVTKQSTYRVTPRSTDNIFRQRKAEVCSWVRNKEKGKRSVGPALCSGRSCGTLPGPCISLSLTFLICKMGCHEESGDDGTEDLADTVSGTR